MTWPNPGSSDPYQQPQQPQQPYPAPQYPAQPYDTPYGIPQPTSGQPYSPAPAYPTTPAPGDYQQYPAQPGYPQPYQQYPAQPYAQSPATNTMAILALVFAFVFSPLGIVFGHIARKQIKERGEQGDGLALAGMIIGYVFTGLYVAFCCVYLVAIIGIFGSAGALSTSGSY